MRLDLCRRNLRKMARNFRRKLLDFGVKTKNFLKPNKHLLTTKALVYCYWAGNFALSNYMTLHMRSIGLTLLQITTINSVLAWTSLFGGPLIGALADRTGRYKLTLASCLAIAVVLHILLLLAVPRYTATTIYQPPSEALHNNASAILGEVCNGAGNVSLWNQTADQCAMVSNETGGIVDEFADCWKSCSGSPGISSGDSDQLFCSFLNQSATCTDSCISSLNVTFCIPSTTTSGDQLLTFGLYFAIRLLTGFVMNVCFCMVDTTMIQMTIDNNGDLGFTRMYIQVAMMSMPPISGLLIDHFSHLNGFNDFSIAFYIFGGMLLIALGILLFSKVKVKAPQRQVWTGLGKLVLFRDPKIVGFLLIIFFIGMCIGYMEGFLFLFLDEDLKAPKWLLGLTNTVAGVSAIPFVAFASLFVKFMGHRNILALATVTYGFRFLGYSLTYDPYWILPIEALECLSNGLMWTVVQMYMAQLVPEYLATFQGLAAGIHSGLGIGLGNMLGGLLVSNCGTRFAFQVMSGACFAVGITYFVVSRLCCRRSTTQGNVPENASKDHLVENPSDLYD